MKKVGLILIVLAVSVVSCRRYSQDRNIDLSGIERVVLSADTLGLSQYLLAPRKVFAIGDSIVVFEPKDMKGFLHFYDKHGSLVWKYGMIGNAGNEYVSPNVFANGQSLVILSMNGTYVEMKRGGAEPDCMHVVENKALAMGNNFLALASDGIVIMESASSEDMLVFLGPDGNETGYNHYPVDIPEKIHAFVKKEVIASCTYAISSGLDTLFQAFKYYPSAGVISVRDGNSCYNAFSVEKYNDYKLKDGIPYYDDPVLFYTYAASSGKYFYALFQNETKSSLYKGGVSEVHMFSREGRLIRRYVLDRIIYHFSVSQDDTVIYALGLNGEELAELYVYHI